MGSMEAKGRGNRARSYLRGKVAKRLPVFPARWFRAGSGIVYAAVHGGGAVMAARSAAQRATVWEPSAADRMRLPAQESRRHLGCSTHSSAC